MRSIHLLPLLLLCLLIAGCGGPDPAVVWHDAQADIAAATAHLQKDEWAACQDSWRAAIAKVAPAADLEMDGLTLRTRLDQAKAALTKAVGEAQSRLVASAEQDRAKLLQATNLVLDFGTVEQATAWQTTESPRIVALFNEQEKQQRLAAEAAHREQLAKSWLVLVTSLPGDKSAEAEVRKNLLPALQKAFAPMPVELVDTRPARRTGVGFARLALRWDEVSFGSGNFPGSSLGQAVPEAVDAVLTVRSNVMPSSIDGENTWHESTEVPRQVNLMTLSQMRREKRTVLINALAAKLATLSITNTEELLKAAAARPADGPAWSFHFESQTITEKQGQMMKTGYGSRVEAALDAVSPILAPNDLVKSEDLSGASLGVVTAKMTVMEVPFGSNQGALRTLNGNLPISVRLEVRVVPLGGTSSWTTPRTFTTELPPPEHVTRESLPYVAVQRIDQMLRDIGKQIAKEAPVTVTP